MERGSSVTPYVTPDPQEADTEDLGALLDQGHAPTQKLLQIPNAQPVMRHPGGTAQHFTVRLTGPTPKVLLKQKSPCGTTSAALARAETPTIL